MSRENWLLIKRNKNFNVNIYRSGLVVLILSLLMSTIIGVLIFYVYLHQPERDYYATSGVTPPIKLTSMPTPNESSVPLLEPDPPTDDVPRVIPQ
ncbi:type IVB secretion system protein IcmM/DotJ [Legionella quateirensis]|uniref:Component of the Dot/Icm secretion system, predicted inner membrane protein n=1 Tax=Legionella quateirensis TaxID=45072 RepID=A0A378KPT7_9GAMM|nr:type IVB secretion system protein IcmM/DotJ [Legionella quateirensis]KTD55419.1 Component of the Dot/Icm secretion system, predicted inner membrane protein [Legionella quateirensis]STY16593.1 Component of the Dot/Icm secretion system. inner membrane protein [Legionella quateirensis]